MTLSPAPPATLLRDRLDHWARVRPGDTAITFGKMILTWEQWRQRIARLTGALRDAGVRPGDRLTVLDLNHLATVELTLAASVLGAATVPANFRLSPDQIRYILEDSRPVILFQGGDAHLHRPDRHPRGARRRGAGDHRVRRPEVDRLRGRADAAADAAAGARRVAADRACPGLRDDRAIRRGHLAHRRGAQGRRPPRAACLRRPALARRRELSARDVIAFCRARLAHYQCPTSVDFVEVLPRSATGKVLKRALREPYWTGRERAI